jgi:hypothetical protein
MIIMAIPVASSMEVQELMGQMHNTGRKDNEFFSLCHRGSPRNSTEENRLRKQAFGSSKQAGIDEIG